MKLVPLGCFKKEYDTPYSSSLARILIVGGLKRGTQFYRRCGVGLLERKCGAEVVRAG